jgi:hypothetical protein
VGRLDRDWDTDSLVEGGGVSLRLVGPHGARDLLGSESGDVLEDGLGNVVGPDDGGGLVGSDGGGDVGVGGLGHWVGQGRDLGGDLGLGVSLGGGVGDSLVNVGSLDRDWDTDRLVEGSGVSLGDLLNGVGTGLVDLRLVEVTLLVYTVLRVGQNCSCH